jgi:hypothetical protein
MRCIDESFSLTDSAPTTDGPSDDTLIAQLAAGDREKIVPLLVRYAPRVFSLASACRCAEAPARSILLGAVFARGC